MANKRRKTRRKTKSIAPRQLRTNQLWETFCIEFFRTGKKGDAARTAGYTCKGYNANTIASRLLKQPKVIARLAELQKKAEDAAIGTVVERKKRLTAIYRPVLGELVNEEGGLKEAALYSPAIAEYQVQKRTTKDGDEIVTRSIKLKNDISAISEHNKMDGIYREDTQINIDNRQINFIVRDQQAVDLINQIPERKQIVGP